MDWRLEQKDKRKLLQETGILREAFSPIDNADLFRNISLAQLQDYANALQDGKPVELYTAAKQRIHGALARYHDDRCKSYRL